MSYYLKHLSLSQGYFFNFKMAMRLVIVVLKEQ